MQFPLMTLALIAIARCVMGLESDGNDTIKVHRYGSSRPQFMKKECQQPGVVCLYETTRPSRAVVHSTSIKYKESVHTHQKVIAFKGKKAMAKTLVAIHPGTKVKMQCGEDHFIYFNYQSDGHLKSMDSKGKAMAEWTPNSYSATGSLKVAKTAHKVVKFQCKPHHK